jgi:hypothetical protein
VARRYIMNTKYLSKYLFLNNYSVSIEDAEKLVHDAQVELLQALEESRLTYLIKGFDDIVYKSVDEMVDDAKLQLKYAEDILKFAKTDDFMKSTYEYINKNKKKLRKYSRYDIMQLINNSDFADKFDDKYNVIDAIYSIITYDKNKLYQDDETSLFVIGENFSYVDSVFDTVKQMGVYVDNMTVGAAGFLYLMNNLCSVA